MSIPELVTFGAIVWGVLLFLVALLEGDDGGEE